jgi:lipopolysaccharide export system protein LptA
MFQKANKLLFATFVLPVFLLLWAPACFAERADRNKPIHLEADEVIMDDAQHISTFIGNVRLSQGTLLISGDKIVVVEDKDGYKHATAYGNTAEFRQKREGMEGYVEGYGERIEYDSRAGTMKFHEKARLKRDLDEVSGDNITYNVKTEVFRVNSSDARPGNDQPQRVRAVLQPKANENTALPPAQGALPVTPDPTLAPPNEHE